MPKSLLIDKKIIHFDRIFSKCLYYAFKCGGNQQYKSNTNLRNDSFLHYIFNFELKPVGLCFKNPRNLYDTLNCTLFFSNLWNFGTYAFYIKTSTKNVEFNKHPGQLYKTVYTYRIHKVFESVKLDGLFFWWWMYF